MIVKQANISAFVKEGHVVAKAWKVRDWSRVLIHSRPIRAGDEVEGLEREPFV